MTDQVWLADCRGILERRQAGQAGEVATALLGKYQDLRPISAVGAALRDARTLLDAREDSREGAQLAPTKPADDATYLRPVDYDYRTTRHDVQDAVRDILAELFPPIAKGESKDSPAWRLYRLRVDVLAHGPNHAILGDPRFSPEEIAEVWGAYRAARETVLREIQRVHGAGQKKRRSKSFSSRTRTAGSPAVAARVLQDGPEVTVIVGDRRYTLAEFVGEDATLLPTPARQEIAVTYPEPVWVDRSVVIPAPIKSREYAPNGEGSRFQDSALFDVILSA